MIDTSRYVLIAVVVLVMAVALPWAMCSSQGVPFKRLLPLIICMLVAAVVIVLVHVIRPVVFL